MTTIRRLYLYVVAFVALLVTIFGILNLLTALLERVTGQVALVGDASTLALALAMVIIGAPVWALHWFVAERAAWRNAEARTAPLRHLYLNLTLFASAVTVFIAGLTVVEWLLGTRPRFEPVLPSVAGVIVWGSVWAYHWWTLTRDGVAARRRTLHRWYVYLTAGYGLGFAAWGLTSVLQTLLGWLYGATFSTPLVQTSLWSDELRSAIAGGALGAVYWAFHWLYAARVDTHSTLRQVYLYIIAVVWGLAAVLVSLGELLYETLRYALEPGAFRPANHFAFVPDTLPFLGVGLIVGGYHWAVLRREGRASAAGDQRVHRAYRYLVTAFALGAAVVGATVLLDTLMGLVVPSESGRWWRDPLSFALSLLIIGGPLWAFQWSRAQAEARRGGVDERRALPRRLLLYGVLTLAILAILANLVFVLYQVFEALLEGQAVGLVQDLRASLAIVLVAVPVLAYYGRVLAADRRLGTEQEQRQKTVTVWVAPDARDVIPTLTRDLGAHRVQVLLGGVNIGALTTSVASVDDIARQVAALPGRQVVVIVHEGQIQVYPVDQEVKPARDG